MGNGITDPRELFAQQDRWRRHLNDGWSRDKCLAYLTGRRDAALGESSMVPADFGVPAEYEHCPGFMAAMWSAGYTDESLDKLMGTKRAPQAVVQHFPDWRRIIDDSLEEGRCARRGG